jgi:hypothetical protein
MTYYNLQLVGHHKIISTCFAILPSVYYLLEVESGGTKMLRLQVPQNTRCGGIAALRILGLRLQ